MTQGSFMPNVPEVGRRASKRRKKTKKTHPVRLWARSSVHDIMSVSDELQWFRVGVYRDHGGARKVADDMRRKYQSLGFDVDTWIGDKPLGPCTCADCVMELLEGASFVPQGVPFP